MKKVFLTLALVLCVFATVSAQVKGPIVDKILVDAKTQEDIAIKDVAAGKSDLFNYTTSGTVYKGLPADVQGKLDPYTQVGGTYHDIYMNPYPNAAPYTGTVDGKTVFNPFAIREVRFAMNLLVNRKKIVDEILTGAGVAMLTPVTPGQPNSSRFALIAGKLGLTASGNEAKALKDIDAAMNAAANLPENKGKLVKSGQWWNYNGAPISVKYAIRVDDPNVRVPMGRMIADQIEKAGIKVDRLEYDRTKCRDLWDKSDPKDLKWHLYTSAWGGGQTYAFWDGSIAQMYGPWYASLPGGNKAGVWSYANPEIDSLTQDCVNGRVKDAAEYYSKLYKATEIGVKEAVRVFLVGQTAYSPSNKDRFNARMATGAGDGINKFSMYTADVKPDAAGIYKGLKVLRQTGFSSSGALFMSSWDPIGVDGCGDTYSQAVVQTLGDPGQIAGPTTGIPIPMTASWSGVKTQIESDKDGNITGKLPIPASAVIWNEMTKKWESGIAYVDLKGDGSEYGYKSFKDDPALANAWSTATYKIKYGKWHSGRAITQADYRYAQARVFELCIKRSDDDKVYEESYASSVNPNLPRTRGFLFNKDGTITVYANANYPMDQASLAALMEPSLLLQGSNYGTYVPWEIHEAIKAVVAEGSKSGEVFVFNSNGDFTEIDLIGQNCVADIKVKLEELKAKKHVPASLVGFVTQAEAVKAYELALAFIAKYGHAYISNGGFILEKWDPQSNTAILTANRDPAYPFEKGYFTKLLTTTYARIDAVKVPAYAKGKDLVVGLTVADVAYPSNVSKALAKATVNVTLIADKETIFSGKAGAKAGEFTVTIPAAALDALKPGSYTLVAEATGVAGATAVETSTVIVF